MRHAARHGYRRGMIYAVSGVLAVTALTALPASASVRASSRSGARSAAASATSLPVTAEASAPEFAPRADYAVHDGWKSLAVGDVNGDGIQDVVVNSRNYGVVSVLLGKHDGTLGAAHDYPVDELKGTPGVARDRRRRLQRRRLC